MRRIILNCCEKSWLLDLNCVPTVGDTVRLLGLDESKQQDAWFYVTIVSRSICPYEKTSQLFIDVAPTFGEGMTYEYIKENITPKDAIHDT